MSAFPFFVGEHESLRQLQHLIKKVAPLDATVLITGESGTGKELAARAIHALSSRADATFVPVNCGAIPSELLESELFGHERGAFTGAIGSRAGVFQLANNGTVFLDEIGEMSPRLQVKLLRVLQDGVIRPVGSDRTYMVDARIIAATNKDLQLEVERGTFREDLFYRLQVIPLVMPPLRERRSDIPLLVKHFLGRKRKRQTRPVQITDDSLDLFCEYSWPGNVRELENLIERLVILSEDGWIRAENLPPKIRLREVELARHQADPFFGTDPVPAVDVGRGELDDQKVRDLLYGFTKARQIELREAGTLQELMDRAESIYLSERLQMTRSIAEAARSLGLSRAGLYKKMKKHRFFPKMFERRKLEKHEDGNDRSTT